MLRNSLASWFREGTDREDSVSRRSTARGYGCLCESPCEFNASRRIERDSSLNIVSMFRQAEDLRIQHACHPRYLMFRQGILMSMLSTSPAGLRDRRVHRLRRRKTQRRTQCNRARKAVRRQHISSPPGLPEWRGLRRAGDVDPLILRLLTVPIRGLTSTRQTNVFKTHGMNPVAKLAVQQSPDIALFGPA